MRRQGLVVTLADVEMVRKEINEEMNSTEKVLKRKIKNRKSIGIIFPIVNYPTQSGKRTCYCSDTWMFEKKKKVK